MIFFTKFFGFLITFTIRKWKKNQRTQSEKNPNWKPVEDMREEVEEDEGKVEEKKKKVRFFNLRGESPSPSLSLSLSLSPSPSPSIVIYRQECGCVVLTVDVEN